MSTARRPPFTVIVPTIYGQMLLNRHDINQTEPLLKSGMAVDHDEITLLARFLQALGPDAVFVDVGANVGTYALALSAVVGAGGKAHAFEPQRIIFNMLAGSVALNGIENVYCYNVALGEREGTIEVPQFDYNAPLNFGSIEFGPQQRERLSQERGRDPHRAEHVPMTTIDRFEFPSLHLMKIDAEGMELAVLAGAEATLRRCRPVLYVEYLKSDQQALRGRIESFDYTVCPSKTNFLCVPCEMGDRIQIQGGGEAK